MNFSEEWSKLTSDRWVLNIVQEGLKLIFKCHPPITGTRITKFQNCVQRQCILDEVDDLLKKSAIEVVPKDQEGLGFYSTFFIVPKKDGGHRPILNLKPLNVYLKNQHFKMETLRSIIQALEQGDWAVSLDLKDAYLHIPMYPSDRQFLRFCIQGKHYQFKAMPFGLATAPGVFTKLMAAVGGFLRTKQIHIFMYLDDWLIQNNNKALVMSHLQQSLTVLIDVGLVVNVKKSQLVPSQRITYLGADFHLWKGVVQPTQERFRSLCESIAVFQQEAYIPARVFLRVLGLMAACIDLVPMARLHMRPIQLYLLSQWRPHVDSIHQMILIREPLILHLLWWTRHQNIFKGMSIQSFIPQETVWTDASMMGWGAHMNNKMVSGEWSETMQHHHINMLEMMAVKNALHRFQFHLHNKQVLIRTDNSTVVTYINRQGGTRSPRLCMLTWEILQWCCQNRISLRAAHIPGKKNILADGLSRGRPVMKMTEWSLSQSVADRLFCLFERPNIDLFATRDNRKVTVYCSPFPDPEAWACDALAVNWTGMYAYAFPPPILVPKVLKKVSQETCVVLLVAPFSPKQSWHPVLLELLVEFPRILPVSENMLTQQKGRVCHPDPNSLKLTAWKISRDITLRKNFLRKLKDTSSVQGDSQREKCMMQDLESTKVGVLQGKSVHTRPL